MVVEIGKHMISDISRFVLASQPDFRENPENMTFSSFVYEICFVNIKSPWEVDARKSFGCIELRGFC